MKNTKYSFTGNLNHQQRSAPQTTPSAPESKWGPKLALPPGIRTTARDYANPVDYKHPYPSMAQFADLLALHYDANRTRHAYYRQLRLLHQHFTSDPSTITEAQLREYFLFVKLKKHWKPKPSAKHWPRPKCFLSIYLANPIGRSFLKSAPRITRPSPPCSPASRFNGY